MKTTPDTCAGDLAYRFKLLFGFEMTEEKKDVLLKDFGFDSMDFMELVMSMTELLGSSLPEDLYSKMQTYREVEVLVIKTVKEHYDSNQGN